MWTVVNFVYVLFDKLNIDVEAQWTLKHLHNTVKFSACHLIIMNNEYE